MLIVEKTKEFVSNLVGKFKQNDYIEEIPAEEMLSPEAQAHAEKTNRYLRELVKKAQAQNERLIKQCNEQHNIIMEWEDYSKNCQQKMEQMTNYINNLEVSNVKLRNLYSQVLDDKIRIQERYAAAFSAVCEETIENGEEVINE